MPRTLRHTLHTARPAFIDEFIKLYGLVVANKGAYTEEQEDRYRDICITAGRELRELREGYSCGILDGDVMVFINATLECAYREGIEEMIENTFDGEIEEKFDEALRDVGADYLCRIAGFERPSIDRDEAFLFLVGLEEGAASRFGWRPDYAMSGYRVAELAELARLGRAADGHVTA